MQYLSLCPHVFTVVAWRPTAGPFIANNWLSRSACSILIFIACTGNQNRCWAQQRDTAEQQIKKLIDQLGDDDFQVRVRASQRLLEFGDQALPRLQAVANDIRVSADHEIQLRAIRLVAQLKRELAKRNADRFLASEAILPGWTEFSNRYGNEPQRRALYADLYQSAPELFETPPPPNLDQELYRVFTSISYRGASQDVGASMLAVLFVATQSDNFANHNEDEVSESNLQTMASILLRDSTQDWVKSNRHRDVILDLVNRFQRQWPSEQPFFHLRFRLYQAYRDPVFLPSLIEMLESPERSLVQRSLAANELAQLQSKSNDDADPALARLALDDQVVAQFLVSTDEQPTARAGKADSQTTSVATLTLGDACRLAWLVRNQLDPSKFGYAPDAVDSSGEIDFKRAGFFDPTARQQSIMQWRKAQKSS